ncbi:DUF3604 domain-containing protein [Candidatus Poribacteria bacterium]|jgi:hypothetical protein|nr:DUF3604 domain-containing protein [Candidatus Poribacteria bacterium]MBT5537152.1 DUF3604 domain-containing protein [Candidatus Poribacteria bacterium]MBT5712065.1 DUF3604 domain-containing protein [Candidatus Poribacteria bacterium]MBT7096208.1 DUF3604 domain-containing protein [Candidatus Poribacteria bacterium]MBT7803973.1 DUF3604 domain-containing protein [Candidatus Poribacteria bacterium]
MALSVYYGDIHNHCGISYGHGPLEDALANARQQLDFCSVTGHAHWPDMPDEPGRLDGLVQYHLDGFAKLADNWPAVLDTMNGANDPGRFVTFPSFEWHSMRSGDHAIYYRDGVGELLRPDSIEDLHAQLTALDAVGVAVMANPHHIGYLRGSRGINWDHYKPRFSPVVEMMSMHGCAESDESPKPYLHTMGPSDVTSTMHYGLAQGHVFGVVGSTDHHSAHPGSYGHGRMGVWAEDLTREAIWDAIHARRTYALTGDRIALDFTLNGHAMGSVIEDGDPSRHLSVTVEGGAAIHEVDVLRNGRLVHRHSPLPFADPPPNDPARAKILLALGWGERGSTTHWDARFGIEDGRVLDVEPRFRGTEVVAPQDEEPDAYAYSTCERTSPTEARIRTRTDANPTTSTPGMQALSLEVEMPRAARVYADLGVKRVSYTLAELTEGSRSGYVGGFVTPAYRFARAALRNEYSTEFEFVDVRDDATTRDWYTVRVCQTNGQWAWSSPIWI